MQFKPTLCLVSTLVLGISQASFAAESVPSLFSPIPFSQQIDIASDPSVQNLDVMNSAFSVESVAINSAALSQATDKFYFNLGPGAFYEVTKTRSADLGEGYHYWHGTMAAPQPVNLLGNTKSTSEVKTITKNGKKIRQELAVDNANFVINGGRVFGQIRMEGKVFEVQTLQDGRQIMVERDFSKIGYEDDTPLESKSRGGKKKQDFLAPLAVNSSETQAISPLAVSNIRVMQIISNRAIDSLGGTGPAVDRMNFFISQSNQAYAATGIEITFQSAGLFRTEGGSERSTAQSNVQGLVNTNDGFQDSITTNTRNSRSADLVGMIVATPNDPGICGIVNNIGANANQAFFVVKASCTDFTFVHEVGHLFGARHQNDGTRSPFAFGHGIADFTGNFRSIMGTSSTGLPRLGGFSDPAFTVGGRPFGTATFRDNTRVHEIRASEVAGFR